MMRLGLAAPAKVNLSLKVTGRRADGRHELDSLVVFATVADLVSLEEAEELSLVVEGPFAEALEGESDNLVLRAARLFRVRRGARITLTKNLPVAAGLGGGSSDAAAALRLLAALWKLPLPDDDAVRLGADLPVCLFGRPARLRGIGERVEAVALPDFALLLVNPGIALPTGEVFAAFEGPPGPAPDFPARFSDLEALLAYLRAAANDLEVAAIRLRPEIGAVLKAIENSPGCRLARMSGSGATCFGIFAGLAGAEAAAAALSAARPGWWVQPAALQAPEKPS
ncbi:MAG: 4-(cytidine 5'-diphospho)-2-C-methyl-D-erythritol kinase [Rhodovibrionaceae bacterium]